MRGLTVLFLALLSYAICNVASAQDIRGRWVGTNRAVGSQIDYYATYVFLPRIARNGNQYGGHVEVSYTPFSTNPPGWDKKVSRLYSFSHKTSENEISVVENHPYEQRLWLEGEKMLGEVFEGSTLRSYLILHRE